MDKLEQFKTILKVYAKVIDDGLANKEHFKDECEGKLFASTFIRSGINPKFISYLKNTGLIPQELLADKQELTRVFTLDGECINLHIDGGYKLLRQGSTYINRGWVNIDVRYSDGRLDELVSEIGRNQSRKQFAAQILSEPVKVFKVANLGLDNPEITNRERQQLQELMDHQNQLMDVMRQFDIDATERSLTFSKFSTLISDAAENHDNVIFHGAPGTGKTFNAIRAIAAGKVAAANIDNFLGFNHVISVDVESWSNAGAGWWIG